MIHYTGCNNITRVKCPLNSHANSLINYLLKMFGLISDFDQNAISRSFVRGRHEAFVVEIIKNLSFFNYFNQQTWFENKVQTEMLSYERIDTIGPCIIISPHFSLKRCQGKNSKHSIKRFNRL